jgi:SAM-dependent methyltransferase
VNRLGTYQTGSGTGAIAPDGCAVDVYSLLPVGREPQVIHDAIPSGATVLELGAGAGRVTHPLLALGHPVVAVDESAEMLARISGAECLQADITELALGRHFAAVVLGSHLINAPDAELRRAFLAACARHVAPDGVVLIEQAPLAFLGGMVPMRFEQDGLVTVFRNVRRPGPNRYGWTIDYRKGEHSWSQNVVVEPFDPAELAGAGLRFDRFRTEDESWFTATLA